MVAGTADDVSTLIGEAASRIETAKAKINLALHVVGQRVDGMHLIDSLIVFAEEADTLQATVLDSGAMDLNVVGEFAADIDPEDANLAWQAVTALLDACGGLPPSGVFIELTKRLPVAAGLGGGSADAAATLRLLNRIWRLGLNADVLTRIATDLGADVPVCLASRPSHVQGIGEVVAPVAGIPSLPVLLVNPGGVMRTRDIFRTLERKDNAPLPPLPARFGSRMEVVFWLRKARNDLYDAAKAANRIVEVAVGSLASDPECVFARMTGSGATCFGVFMSLNAAKRAAGRLRAARPDWWMTVTETCGS